MATHVVEIKTPLGPWTIKLLQIFLDVLIPRTSVVYKAPPELLWLEFAKLLRLSRRVVLVLQLVPQSSGRHFTMLVSVEVFGDSPFK